MGDRMGTGVGNCVLAIAGKRGVGCGGRGFCPGTVGWFLKHVEKLVSSPVAVMGSFWFSPPLDRNGKGVVPKGVVPKRWASGLPSASQAHT